MAEAHANGRADRVRRSRQRRAGAAVPDRLVLQPGALGEGRRQASGRGACSASTGGARTIGSGVPASSASPRWSRMHSRGRGGGVETFVPCAASHSDGSRSSCGGAWANACRSSFTRTGCWRCRRRGTWKSSSSSTPPWPEARDTLFRIWAAGVDTPEIRQVLGVMASVTGRRCGVAPVARSSLVSAARMPVRRVRATRAARSHPPRVRAAARSRVPRAATALRRRARLVHGAEARRDDALRDAREPPRRSRTRSSHLSPNEVTFASRSSEAASAD